MIRGRLARRAAELAEARTPFVEATVVRAQRPTSVRPGDPALVLADGTIEGFVGGVCAESSVRLHALRALETGEPLLLRLVPEGGENLAGGGAGGAEGAVSEGAVTEHNPCLSGGALEIFLEPCLPPPRLVVVGEAPVADALAALAADAGFEAARSGGADGAAAETPAPRADDAALVVASHGRDEEDALAAALHAGVPYVGLVASTRRGAAVRAALEVPDELRGQLHTPAGLAIGARTPEEIALAILAEIIAERRGAEVRERSVAAGGGNPRAAGSADAGHGRAAPAAARSTATAEAAHASCDHHGSH